MLINLSDVLTTEGMRETREVPLEMACFRNGAEEIEVLSKSPVAFAFTNVEDGRARMEYRARLELRGSCDRCLKEVPVALDLECERLLVSPEGRAGEETEDCELLDGYTLDVEALMQNEVLVNWPTKILCREGCKGICPVCGQDRNLGECGCDTFVPDPRMAVIQDIFNASKEV